jgi:hypothetical protein
LKLFFYAATPIVCAAGCETRKQKLNVWMQHTTWIGGVGGLRDRKKAKRKNETASTSKKRQRYLPEK